MKRISTISILLAALLFICAAPLPSFADEFDSVLQRWTQSFKKVDKTDGSNIEVKATYYSAEFIEALIQKEAKANLWTQQEADDFKYNLLNSLKLDEYIPVRVEFINNGPTMYLGPFDVMVKMRMGGKAYKPADYDKRLNFKFQGKKDGLVFFPRYDEKTGKDLLKGVKSVNLDFSTAVSPILEGQTFGFVWDVSKDDPQALYKGKAANRLEQDRLLKRLQKLRGDKSEQEAKLNSINDEITTIQTRLDELSKQ